MVAFGSHVIVDVVGYFTGASGPTPAPVCSFRRRRRECSTLERGAAPLRPWRARDRRAPGDGRSGRRGRRQLDADADDRARLVGHLPVAHARGEASTINSDAAGQTVANLGIVPVSDFGVTAYSEGGTHLVVDVTGWFTGSPVAATESGRHGTIHRRCPAASRPGAARWPTSWRSGTGCVWTGLRSPTDCR